MTHKHRLLVHTSRQPIRWGDMDALGHVNNTVYFRYMEQARIEWLFGLYPERSAYGGTGPVIVNASCTFLEPLVYPGDVEVRMYLGDPGRSSVGSSYDLLRDGRVVAEGAAKIVWIDLATGRSAPLPNVIVAPLQAAADATGGRGAR
ncbi:MAG: acyl-CoA thioesterase [Betaproteobacteria bacterium]|nr:acyl-CoA thioesterase [Betaproteobacteria bacterium]MBK7589931.1 acyl-CoA thioesterase [Betaproteobacteria bacterium]